MSYYGEKYGKRIGPLLASDTSIDDMHSADISNVDSDFEAEFLIPPKELVIQKLSDIANEQYIHDLEVAKELIKRCRGELMQGNLTVQPVTAKSSVLDIVVSEFKKAGYSVQVIAKECSGRTRKGNRYTFTHCALVFDV